MSESPEVLAPFSYKYINLKPDIILIPLEI
jgi:hypothetical protein